MIDPTQTPMNDSNIAEPEILLVEDNPNDAELVIRALKRSGVRAAVSHVDDGAQAIEFLLGAGAYVQEPLRWYKLDNGTAQATTEGFGTILQRFDVDCAARSRMTKVVKWLNMRY